MKTFARRLFCVCVSIFFSISGHHALAADTNPPPRLTIELRDGSRIIGTSTEKNFKFHSELLGELKLKVSEIRSLESVSTNTEKLITTGGDSMTVSFVDSELTVKTDFGKVELPVASIRKLSVSVISKFDSQREGLVALWSGEKNANDCAGHNNGQLFGSVGFASGKIGQAFELNESAGGGDEFSGDKITTFQPNQRNGFILIPASAALDVGSGDGFTIMVWIKPSSVSREMLIAEYEKVLGTFASSDVGVNFAIQQTTGCLLFNVLDINGANHILSSPPDILTPEVWQHVALTYDKASGAAALYLNGTVVAQANFGSIVPQTSFHYLLFGGRTTFGSVANPRSTFSGEMDEISVYNRALSNFEISEGCKADNKN